MHKKLISLLLYLVLLQQITAQTKINYAINVGLNQSFLSDLNGVQDYTGFSVKDKSIGTGLGASVEFKTLPNLDLIVGGNLYKAEKQSFRYYGILYGRNTVKPQIYLRLKQYFSKKHNYYFNIGMIASFELFDIYENTHYSSGLIRPERVFVENAKSGIYPIMTIGIGKRKVLRSGRIIAYNLFFNYGHRVVDTYTFERLTPPYIKSDFSYKGNSINYSIKWFFKKQ